MEIHREQRGEAEESRGIEKIKKSGRKEKEGDRIAENRNS